MTVHDLFPAYVDISYTSPVGQHVQRIPTLAFNPGGGGTIGAFDTWDSVGIDAETMVEDLITLEAEFFATTVNFNSYTIWTKASPTAAPVIQGQKNIDIDGTVAAPGWYKAAQATWTFKTTLNNLFKVVMLDVSTLNSFDKITGASVSADQTAFINALFADSNGWSGRDGGKPNFFLQIAFTLNEKLRREYRMN